MGFVFSPRSFMKKNEIIDGQNKKRRSYLKYFLKKSTNVTLYHDNQLTGTDKVIKKVILILKGARKNFKYLCI